MRTRFAVYAVLATFAIGGIAFAADALVVSDAEQIEQLADDLHERSAADALLRWVDVSREPVLVSRGHQNTRFEEDDDYAIAEELGVALEPLGGADVVQQTVRLDGARATLALRTRSNDVVTDTTIDLVKNGQGWLVTSVRTR